VVHFHILRQQGGEVGQGALLLTVIPEERKAQQDQQEQSGKKGNIGE
jgi:hypothetical protein